MTPSRPCYKVLGRQPSPCCITLKQTSPGSGLQTALSMAMYYFGSGSVVFLSMNTMSLSFNVLLSGVEVELLIVFMRLLVIPDTDD